jgi:hypothetical protein
MVSEFVSLSIPSDDSLKSPKVCAQIGLQIRIFEVTFIDDHYDLYQNMIAPALTHCTGTTECGEPYDQITETNITREDLRDQVRKKGRKDRKLWKTISFGGSTPMCSDAPNGPLPPGFPGRRPF